MILYLDRQPEWPGVYVYNPDVNKPVDRHSTAMCELMMRTVPEVELSAYDISDVYGNITVSSLIRSFAAIEAMDLPLDTIIATNFTLWDSVLVTEFKTQLARFASKYTFVVAGGNRREHLDNLIPCCVPGTIVVGSLTKSGDIASFNSIPGETIFDVMVTGTSQRLHDGTVTSGTSLSSAYYAAALWNHRRTRTAIDGYLGIEIRILNESSVLQ